MRVPVPRWMFGVGLTLAMCVAVATGGISLSYQRASAQNSQGNTYPQSPERVANSTDPNCVKDGKIIPVGEKCSPDKDISDCVYQQEVCNYDGGRSVSECLKSNVNYSSDKSCARLTSGEPVRSGKCSPQPHCDGSGKCVQDEDRQCSKKDQECLKYECDMTFQDNCKETKVSPRDCEFVWVSTPGPCDVDVPVFPAIIAQPICNGAPCPGPQVSRIQCTPTPTFTPTRAPTRTPTWTPTEGATHTPTWTPTAIPTNTPTPRPTNTPTTRPTSTPTLRPTSTPTLRPTSTPTTVATNTPTASPTPTHTKTPTYTPTDRPTAQPSSTPTSQPSATPTVGGEECGSCPGVCCPNNPTCTTRQIPDGKTGYTCDEVKADNSWNDPCCCPKTGNSPGTFIKCPASGSKNFGFDMSCKGCADGFTNSPCTGDGCFKTCGCEPCTCGDGKLDKDRGEQCDNNHPCPVLSCEEAAANGTSRYATCDGCTCVYPPRVYPPRPPPDCPASTDNCKPTYVNPDYWCSDDAQPCLEDDINKRCQAFAGQSVEFSSSCRPVDAQVCGDSEDCPEGAAEDDACHTDGPCGCTAQCSGEGAEPDCYAKCIETCCEPIGDDIVVSGECVLNSPPWCEGVNKGTGVLSGCGKRCKSSYVFDDPDQQCRLYKADKKACSGCGPSKSPDTSPPPDCGNATKLACDACMAGSGSPRWCETCCSLPY